MKDHELICEEFREALQEEAIEIYGPDDYAIKDKRSHLLMRLTVSS